MHGLLPLYVLGMDMVWLGEAVSHSGAEWIEFSSTNCHSLLECDDHLLDPVVLWGVLCWKRYGEEIIVRCHVVDKLCGQERR